MAKSRMRHISDWLAILSCVALIWVTGTGVWASWMPTYRGSQSRQLDSLVTDISDKRLTLASTGNRVDKTKLTLVEFSDFECAFCRRFALESLDALRERYIDTGLVAFEYRYFPLPEHGWGARAAAYNLCATEQGKFWESHDALYGKNGTRATSAVNVVEQLNLDQESFNGCLKVAPQRITASYAEGVRLGLIGTPTMFIGRFNESTHTIDLLKQITGAVPLAVFERELNSMIPGRAGVVFDLLQKLGLRS